MSSNRERFTTGKILGAGERRRSSATTETNYIDKKHIDSLTSKFEENASGQINKQLFSRHIFPYKCFDCKSIKRRFFHSITIFTTLGAVSKSEVLSASNVPRKLRNLSEVFHHSKDDYTDTVKQEVKVNKIDTENLFTSENQDKEKKSTAVRVGKLKLEENIFEKNEEDLNSKKSPEIKVGKINSENIFKSKAEDEEVKSSIRVGKLDKKVYELKSDEVKNTVSEVRVGKINTENLFQRAEENSEELLSICKPGKLSEDKLILSSNLGETKFLGFLDFIYAF